MLVTNLAGVGPTAGWTWGDHWWAFGAPFLAAVIWWSFADSIGWTQRKAMEKVDQKREARRQQNLESMGLDEKSRAKRKQAQSK